MFVKKNLVAVAALMAVAGAAQAQSSVKLYGYVEAAVGSFEYAHDPADTDKAGFRTTRVESGQMMTSFLGFSGSEDLGGGLKAEFALETFIGADTGATLTNVATGFWGRGSYVALSGGFGKVALGQYDNPLFTSGYTYNPFGSSMGFSPTMRHLYAINVPAISGPTPHNLGVAFDTGFVNSVTYESPVMAGFQLIGQYSPKESASTTAKNSWSVAGSYNAGPLSAMVTYVKAGSAVAYGPEQKVIDFGASYDFGVAKAFLQYTDMDYKAVNDETIRNYQIGVSVPLSDKASVLASFGQQKAEFTGFGTSKDDIFSLGYEYALSKRTGVYGVFSNNRQTDLKSGQIYAVGVKHSF